MYNNKSKKYAYLLNKSNISRLLALRLWCFYFSGQIRQRGCVEPAAQVPPVASRDAPISGADRRAALRFIDKVHALRLVADRRGL